MDPHRSQRVSEAIREELSEMIGYEMGDPRIAMVDVIEVLVAPDLRHARVRLHLEGDDQSRSECLRAIEGARHYLRRQLASRLRLYRMPELHFEPDVERSGPRPGCEPPSPASLPPSGSRDPQKGLHNE